MTSVTAPPRLIRLRGVAVHNLQRIDLDIAHRRLIVLCGVSGSGKSSLAFDTLYAEGQRRYIESFSAYTRQFLERLEKPEAEAIEGIPVAIAVANRSPSRSSRSTVGTVTETSDYLRLLFAKIGRIVCRQCGREVRRHTPQDAAEQLEGFTARTRFQIAFMVPAPRDATLTWAAAWREEGFTRAIVSGRTWDLTSELPPVDEHATSADETAYVVVDRLRAGDVSRERLRDSLETAFEKGGGKCCALVELADVGPSDAAGHGTRSVPATGGGTQTLPATVEVDRQHWRQLCWSAELRCDDCGREYADPEPRLYSFNSPLGACPECEGFGNTIDVDMELVVPDASKTLREGAIAPWNTPSYAHELEELLALAADYGVPVDIPFRELPEESLRLIREGVPERKFGGLAGFFAWLERRKYTMHIRVFLSRFRSHRTCAACGGTRLRDEALAAQVGEKNIAEISAMKVRDAARFFGGLALADWERSVGRMMLEQVEARLRFLEMVGLGYLTLDRPARTLSGGEAQRVALTSALGSSLVNMLYILDEPSVGLHPRDTDRLIHAVRQLRQRGNTVVVVEHEEAFIRAADQVIEIGPGAGQRGGRVVFQGTPAEMEACTTSLTGDYLSGRRMFRSPARRRTRSHGCIRLVGARGNNLRNLTVEFPLGMLCMVTGVSGSGKSTLVEDTLYPALCRRLRKDAPKPADHDEVLGDGQLDDVVLVDQRPIGRSPRSNPVTYVKAFDEIRSVFADTLDSRMRNYTASHFSFNVEGGRCSACAGDGYVEVGMQFLADAYVRCSQCHGRRYRREILEVTYRGRNIAEVLDMTAREAFAFFRGHRKVQMRLKRLIDVGLDYLRLGQPANTLSGGESQRLKLAGFLSATRRGRTLVMLDEPTTGLHFYDVVQLLDCFDSLLTVGHSLLVVEHNLQLMKFADYIIDLGPGAADEGGRVVAVGTPEEIIRNPESITGQFLARAVDAELQVLPV